MDKLVNFKYPDKVPLITEGLEKPFFVALVLGGPKNGMIAYCGHGTPLPDNYHPVYLNTKDRVYLFLVHSDLLDIMEAKAAPGDTIFSALGVTHEMLSSIL